MKFMRKLGCHMGVFCMLMGGTCIVVVVWGQRYPGMVVRAGGALLILGVALILIAFVHSEPGS